MNLLYVIYTHNRPAVLKECLRTVFENTKIKPDEVIICDDASDEHVKFGLFQFANDNSKKGFNINFMGFNHNQGYGVNAEFGIRYIQWRNPQYVMVIESDYIFRVGWMEEALAVLKACPMAVGLSGYSNPDYYDINKTSEMFPRIMREDFGVDLAERGVLHAPKKIDTEAGQIEVQGTTNACGTFLLNWNRIQHLVARYPEIQQKVFDRSCNKQPGGNRRYFGDGPFTHGMSHYWYLAMRGSEKQPDPVHAPWLDICDFSIGEHINGAGINGGIVAEGRTFVGSPKWPINPNNFVRQST